MILKKLDDRRYRIGPCRISFPHVFEPDNTEMGGGKYSVTLLIDKDDKDALALIEDGINNAKEYGKSSKWGGKIPKVLREPLRDGDLSEREEEAGHWVLRTSSTRRPLVLDQRRQEIFDQGEIYGGCYCSAIVTFAPYSMRSNGVGCYFDAIQKLKDGEAFGGGARTSVDDFDDFEDEDGMLD